MIIINYYCCLLFRPHFSQPLLALLLTPTSLDTLLRLLSVAAAWEDLPSPIIATGSSALASRSSIVIKSSSGVQRWSDMPATILNGDEAIPGAWPYTDDEKGKRQQDKSIINN